MWNGRGIGPSLAVKMHQAIALSQLDPPNYFPRTNGRAAGTGAPLIVWTRRASASSTTWLTEIAAATSPSLQLQQTVVQQQSQLAPERHGLAQIGHWTVGMLMLVHISPIMAPTGTR